MSKSYEQVRYVGYPFAQTHPDRLATMAGLFGMAPPPIDRARVLEIGCCDGGNLIPMALTLPNSQFVGIDLTEIDIHRARQTVAALNLFNTQFHVMDLTALPGTLGQFDYIVAHGVYSWVPAAVREQLLAVTKASLTQNGVAYISFNTLPGGHLRLMLREMMLYHAGDVEDPEERLSRARQLLEFVASNTREEDEYGTFVRKEIEQMFSRPNYGLFHDELEENYQPVYFHEFVAHAARYGLQYLAEANYFDMRPDILRGEGAAALEKFTQDPLIREQYLDFARCRRFRQTLLCHGEIQLDRVVRPDRMTAFYFSSPARLIEHESAGDGTEEFHGPKNSQVKTAHPLVRQFMHAMIAAWPQCVPFSELPGALGDVKDAREILHALTASGIVEIRTAPPRLSVIPGDRPMASPLARMQATESLAITTLRHTSIASTGALENRLISLLDGTRDRSAIMAELVPFLETEKSPSELGCGTRYFSPYTRASGFACFVAFKIKDGTPTPVVTLLRLKKEI